MKCVDANKLLDDYLAGALPRDSSRTFEEHLESCPRCSQLLLIDDQQLDILLQSPWHLSTPSIGFSEKVMQQVRREKKMTWFWWVVVWSGYISLWALGALTFALRSNSSWVVGLALDMMRLVRSMSHVATVIAQAVQFYSFTTIGLTTIFASAAIIFWGFSVINRGESLQ